MKRDFSFRNFLCGTSLSNYVFQKMPYAKQIELAKEKIKEADFILIGAGSGLSTAAGAEYGGKWFEENFSEFQKKYGKGDFMRDMYSAGFYPFPDEESFWGYWARHALLGGIELDVTSLYKKFLLLFEEKNLFCLTTNVDKQFEKAGLSKEKIFETQGDYFHIQCAKGCHKKTYDATNLFKKMKEKTVDCKIPSSLVPKCPVCGGAMNMNLRSDNYFVEDENWKTQEKNFSLFLENALNSKKKILLVEVGVGFNTPIIIRFPFEKLVRENKNVELLRLNLKEAVIPQDIENKSIAINESLEKVIFEGIFRFGL